MGWMRWVLTGVCVGSLFSCGTIPWGVGYSPKNSSAQKYADPERENCEIEVYRSSKPDRAYEELGIVSVRPEWGLNNCSYHGALLSAKKEACLQGGDALMDIREGTFEMCTILNATLVRWKD